MLARVPITLALDLDPGTVDQTVQRTLRAAIRDVHRRSLLAAAQGAEVGRRPVPGLVGRGSQSAHDLQRSRWIHEINPLTPTVQQSHVVALRAC